MFNPATFENSRGDGIGVLEIVEEVVPRKEQRRRIVPEEEQPRRFVPLKRTVLSGEVVGPLAALRLTQVYGYSRAQCDRVLEAVYRFPLPGDAAVTSVQVRFGEVEIRAELKAREEAEADYEQAKREGRQAVLLSRESLDVFTLLVAGIEPDQDVTVETAYVQLARAEGAGWSLRTPLTTAPRYVRSDEITARHAQGQPLLLLRDPGHCFSLDLKLTGAGWVESRTHELQVTKEGDALRVGLQDGEVVPDRDCVLSWQPWREEDHPALQVWLHRDQPSGETHFLALVVPPAAAGAARVPREIALLVDRSGSMGGPKWAAADWAVKKFLTELAEHDTFNLGLFHSTTRWLWKAPRPAGAGARSEAIRFLEQHRDSGGTELGVALEQALGLARTEGKIARHVLIVTDAQVADEGRILHLADQEASRDDRRRIDLLCIDAAPNSLLALELAERGGGVARFLTSSPEEEDITTALDETLVDWAAPVLAGLRLEVNGRGVEAAGRQVTRGGEPGWSAIDLGDLPAGRTIWVAGRVAAVGTSDLTFRLLAGERNEIAACRLSASDGAGERPALKALFGARRIAGLEFLVHVGYGGDDLGGRLAHLGYDPDVVLAGRPGKAKKVYAENARQDVAAALRGLLVQESLDYGLASAEVSFVAVRSVSGKLVEGTVPVANALAAGWSEDFMMSSSAAPSSLFLRSPALRLADAQAVLSAHDVPAFSRSRPVGRGDPSAPREAGLGVPIRTLFSGIPVFQNGEALLFDTSRTEDASKLPEGVRLTRLVVLFPDGAPAPEQIDPGTSLLVFVGDLSSPRAWMRLVDLARQGGERPLNVQKLPGQPVRILLVDPTGAWAAAALPIEVVLGWDI